MSEQPLVAIIVLHWNNFEDTRDCLLSLREVSYNPVNIIVVDNHSTNDSLARLQQEFVECEFVENPDNYGFAKGNNMGICRALEHGADYVMLLNNDTIVAPDFLEKLVSAAQQDVRIGAVSGTIYNYDRVNGPTRVIFYKGGRLSYLSGTGRIFELGKLDVTPLRESIPVSYITGCSMMIRRQAIIDTGLLDERFFFGVEDTDFSYRLIRGKYKILYVPQSIIWHKGSGSRSFTPEEFYAAYKAKLVLMKKHLPLLLWELWFMIFAMYLRVNSQNIATRLVRKHHLATSQCDRLREVILSIANDFP